MHVGKRILIADDSGPRTAFITGILKKANYKNIDQIHDAAGALALLRRQEYDLIIVDGQMEPITGLELSRLIKADARLQKIRIILITSRGWDDVAKLDGADGYVIKPFEPEDLTEKVEDVLSTVAQLGSG